jgi:hypothetical protein
MMSETLLEEIVTEVKLRNPDALPEEIFEEVATMLSKEILPQVIKNISLPKFPTYRQVMLSQSKRTKSKIETKAHPPKSLGYTRNMIQEIESVRNEMGWDGIDDSKPKMFITDSTNPYHLQKNIFRLSREDLKIKTNIKEAPEKEREEIANATAQKMPMKPDKNILELSESVQRKIVTEPIFGLVFKSVELKLRNIIATRNLSTEVDVICKSDIEIPTWNKCVLTAHPPAKINFDERMNISTIFDITIRTVINEMKKDADEKTLDYLRNLNRNFFVHVDL